LSGWIQLDPSQDAERQGFDIGHSGPVESEYIAKNRKPPFPLEIGVRRTAATIPDRVGTFQRRQG